MTDDAALDLLTELQDGDKNNAAKTVLDKILLRLYMEPALIAALKDAVVLDGDDGNYRYQIVFHKIPDEFVPDVSRIIDGEGGKCKITNFDENGESYTGFEVYASKEDLKPKTGDNEAVDAEDFGEVAASDKGDKAVGEEF